MKVVKSDVSGNHSISKSGDDCNSFLTQNGENKYLQEETKNNVGDRLKSGAFITQADIKAVINGTERHFKQLSVKTKAD